MSREASTRKLGRILHFRMDYLQKVLLGEKTTTVRKGIVKPLHDEVYLASNGKVYGEARLKSLRFTKLSELTDEDARRDGFENREDLVNALKEIYPDLKDEDWVTIISLDNVSRYSSPLSLKEVARRNNIDTAEAARLVLAHGLAETPEHRVVLAKLALGYTSSAVARELGLPEKRVEEIFKSYIVLLRKKKLVQ